MFSPSTLILAPLSGLYGAATSARLALYRRRLLPAYRVEAPVISVGNITTGGTGKTPLVEWLARMVASEGRRTCVLSRGYRRADERSRVVVSDGARLLADACAGGDEPRLLAENLLDKGVVVISDADRLAAARWASENFKSEVFILDDGFQHLRLERDLDIVTVDGSAPWGNGKLLPYGRLREPLRGLERAALIVITRAELARDVESLRAEARRLSGERAVVLTSTLRTHRLRPLQTSPSGTDAEGGDYLQDDPPQPVGAFCAIGNPEAFFAHLRRDGHELSHTRAFQDHHAYTQHDVDVFARDARQRGARALLTTAKDAVKLRALDFPLPCYVVEVTLAFDDEARLRSLVHEAIRK